MARYSRDRKNSCLQSAIAVVMSSVLISACGSSGSDGGGNNANSNGDNNTANTVGTVASGTTDVGGTTDTGTVASGVTDIGGTTDTGTVASGVTDMVGTTDTGTVASGVTDIGGTTDTGTVASGVTDIGGTTDTGTTVGLANCPPLRGTTNTAAIAGLYNFTEIDEIFGEDIYYVGIDANGNVTDYDYQQDEIDIGENCYLIYPDESVLDALGGTQYEVRGYTDSDENCEIDTNPITAVRQGSNLVVTGQDIFDDDGDGDTTDTITNVYPVLTGVSAASFNACF